MNFNQMTLTELSKELDRFRTQIESQGFPMTKNQKARWKALQVAYQNKNEELAK